MRPSDCVKRSTRSAPCSVRLSAIGLMVVLAGNIRVVFWIAAIPAWVAVALLMVGIDEPKQHADGRPARTLPHWRDVRRFGAAYWSVVVIGAVFTLARFSEAFLILRAHDVGLSLAWTPLALVVMNLTYVASAYPAGKLSDRIGRIGLLALGLAHLDRGRRDPRARHTSRPDACRHRNLGPAPWAHAGFARRTGRRHCARALARLGLRRVLSRRRRGHFVGQPARRRTVGIGRPADDFFRRRGVLRDGPGGAIGMAGLVRYAAVDDEISRQIRPQTPTLPPQIGGCAPLADWFRVVGPASTNRRTRAARPAAVAPPISSPTDTFPTIDRFPPMFLMPRPLGCASST